MRLLSIALLSVLFLATSCEEPTDLNLKDSPPRIVIEGLITNQPGYQYVKVSKSAPFYSSGATPRVTDALITVSDDLGGTYTFIHNPNGHPDSTGIYVPEEAFTGELGRTYSLRVESDGEVYEASDKMLSVTSIDSLSYAINKTQRDDPNEEGKFYEILLYTREPRDEENYYLFKFYRNDSLIHYNRTDVYYTDDTLFGEDIEGFPSPVYYGAGDRARLEIYSLSRRGYVFYNDLYTVLTTDTGGMFGPVPAPPRSNLSNNALGFFQVSAVVMKDIQIGE